MITRIAVAGLALMWVHGWDESRRDLGNAAAELRETAPRAALELCTANMKTCEDTAIRIVTGGMSSKSAPTQNKPLPVSNIPLPPRRP